MIVGSAVTLAVLQIVKKARKPKKSNKVDFKKDSFSVQHNCSECSAECMLRDAKPSILQKNKDLCKEIETRSGSDQL